MKSVNGDRMGRFYWLLILLSFFGPACITLRADAVPGGSYQQSCRNGHVDSGMLIADCRTADGRWAESVRLPGYQQCLGDIANFDGNLRCSKGSLPPSGSYTQTCRYIWVDEYNTLHADCKYPDGSWIEGGVLANVNTCEGDVYNNKGVLVVRAAAMVEGRHTLPRLLVDRNHYRQVATFPLAALGRALWAAN